MREAGLEENEVHTWPTLGVTPRGMTTVGYSGLQWARPWRRALEVVPVGGSSGQGAVGVR